MAHSAGPLNLQGLLAHTVGRVWCERAGLFRLLWSDNGDAGWRELEVSVFTEHFRVAGTKCLCFLFPRRKQSKWTHYLTYTSLTKHLTCGRKLESEKKEEKGKNSDRHQRWKLLRKLAGRLQLCIHFNAFSDTVKQVMHLFPTVSIYFN